MRAMLSESVTRRDTYSFSDEQVIHIYRWGLLTGGAIGIIIGLFLVSVL